MRDDLKMRLAILAEAAKFDVSCSSSGSRRQKPKNGLGNSHYAGICHSWSQDGRCISLLKILLTNACIYDCAYCLNRRSENRQRVALSVDELVKITWGFYKRNYIEGLFLSSGVYPSANGAMEKMIAVAKKLRAKGFGGYIHLKAIPAADASLIEEAGLYADRLSLNLELATEKNLTHLAPEKNHQGLISQMAMVKNHLATDALGVLSAEKKALGKQKAMAKTGKKGFLPAGQTTQFMVGAADESDYMLLHSAEKLYRQLAMKRVYYAAYTPVVQGDARLPAVINPPLLREHRLYQSDWLLRYYHFTAAELLSPEAPHLDLSIDPKAHWAVRHFHLFPIDIMQADLKTLLRIPGIGPISARRIIKVRRFGPLDEASLKRCGAVVRRAKYFITIAGKPLLPKSHYRWLEAPEAIGGRFRLEEAALKALPYRQTSLADWLPELQQERAEKDEGAAIVRALWARQQALEEHLPKAVL